MGAKGPLQTITNCLLDDKGDILVLLESVPAHFALSAIRER